MGLWNKDCSSRLTGATSERTIKVGACHRYQHLQSISQDREDQVNTEPFLPTTGAALNCISEECLRSTFLFEALVAKTGVFMPLKIPQHKKYSTVVKTGPGLAKIRHVGAHLLSNLSNSAT